MLLIGRGDIDGMLISNRTTRSDWLAWETARDPLEVTIPAF